MDGFIPNLVCLLEPLTYQRLWLHASAKEVIHSVFIAFGAVLGELAIDFFVSCSLLLCIQQAKVCRPESLALPKLDESSRLILLLFF